MKKKIEKELAHLENLVENHDVRLENFKIDMKAALNCKDKKEKYMRLTRVSDEINGYCARIDQSNSRIKKTYENGLPRVKELSELESALESRYYNDVQSEKAKELKENRNKGCHPDPYFINTDMIVKVEEVKGVLENAAEKAKYIKESHNINEFSIKKEKES